MLTVLFPAFAFSGGIYGNIKEAERPVEAGVKVKIVSDRTVDSTVTDSTGSYRLYVRERGKLKLYLYYQTDTLSIDVYSYRRPVRYNLVVEKTDEHYRLRRE